MGVCRDGSEGEAERKEVALGGVKVKASRPSAGVELLWKLWGLRGAEMGPEEIADRKWWK